MLYTRSRYQVSVYRTIDPLVSTIPSFLFSFTTNGAFNPLVTNGLSHPYHLDESTSICRGIRSNFSFLFHFSMKFLQANRIAPDWTPRFAASHLGLFCLPSPIKRTPGLYYEPRSSGFPTRSHTNRAVQPHKMARCLKFRI